MLYLALLVIIGCVSARPGSRIAGGTPLTPGELPYLASVQLHSLNAWYHLCGGSLISETRVLTAAHCISGIAADYRVVLGEQSLSLVDGTEQFIRVLNYIIYPDYNGNAVGFPNDIAIIHLSEHADTNSSAISTIPLADHGADFTGIDCTISGWGSTAGSEELKDTPSKATFTAISNAACVGLWAAVPNTLIYPSHVCMLGTAGEAACHYDNGGPMVCNGVLVGIFSWGESSCQGTLPSVMSSVPFFHHWIINH
ncbi:chymotrypsin-like serine proteinase [Haliotis rufescens]|uniref:chymotrypsin-like serine proteinase n=1 Tax=Haliotis rufescens TaxID=6454 RepID=UPI00201F3AAE|nr:chymotrypsin-like serine proteinase [Haliotis rufescens]